MFDSVTTPSMGDFNVAAAIWILRSLTACLAWASWFSAFSTPIVAWRICAVTSAVFASDRFVFATRRLTRAESRVFSAVASCAPQIGRVGRGQDVALLDAVADGGLDLLDTEGRRGGRRGAGVGDQVRVRPERRGRSATAAPGCPVAATSSVTSPVVAALVRYCVRARPIPVWIPPSANTAAPTPTTTSTSTATIFSFMEVPSDVCPRSDAIVAARPRHEAAHRRPLRP